MGFIAALYGVIAYIAFVCSFVYAVAFVGNLNVPRTIARVNNPANVGIFKELGVDEAISATEVLLGALEPKLDG